MIFSRLVFTTKEKNMSTTIFQNDLKTKRTAFTSGKQCLLEIVSVKCSKKTMAYLNDYYDNVVNILTTPPNNTRCTSAYDGLTSIQSMPILKKTSEIFTTTQDYSALKGLSAVKLCASARVWIQMRFVKWESDFIPGLYEEQLCLQSENRPKHGFCVYKFQKSHLSTMLLQYSHIDWGLFKIQMREGYHCKE